MTGVQWYPVTDPGQAAARTAALFRDSYGHEPAGVWAGPGRVNLIGEHVDHQAGLCLPFALPQRTFAAVAPRGDGRIRVRSAQVDGDGGRWEGELADVAPGTVTGWAGYAVGVPWALGRAGHPVPGFDAVVDGQVPLGAGLSSSAALETAIAIALDELAGLGLAGTDQGRTALAQACVRAENEIAGAPTGGLDQSAALRCREGQALLLDFRDASAVPVPLDLAAAGLELLVIDTRARHSHADGGYRDRREGCVRAAELLGLPSLRELEPAGLAAAMEELAADPGPGGDRRPDGPTPADLTRHVVTELARVRQVVQLLADGALLDADRAGRLGGVLDASHASLRDDFAVSCPELDLGCAAARDAGALGARMTGGGFGGSAIALCPAGRTADVADAVASAFAGDGLRAPRFLAASPAAPAGRVA